MMFKVYVKRIDIQSAIIFIMYNEKATQNPNYYMSAADRAYLPLIFTAMICFLSFHRI